MGTKKKPTRIRWDRVIAFVILLVILISILDITLSKPKAYTSPAGEYTCSGHLLKICSGSEAVANYFE